jgi:hypothetical protein
MRDIDIVCNDYVREVTLDQAKELMKAGKTIEVRVYDDKDRIKYWEKYDARDDLLCWSLKEIMYGRFFLVIDQGY